MGKKRPFPDDETLRFVNCACCEEELLGESCSKYWWKLSGDERAKQPIVCARIKGRPYCSRCLDLKPRKKSDVKIVFNEDGEKYDKEGRLENGVKALEGE